MAFKIYTKTGDKGETGLFGGKRIRKDDLRIEAYGTVDELNANLGMLGDIFPDKEEVAFIRIIQADLFTIGSYLAKDPDKEMPLPDLPTSRPGAMEASMDRWDQSLPPLKNFILPGGHPAVSQAHLARCVCRRAERRIVTLAYNAEIDPFIILYLNRLSDYLFVLSRALSHLYQVEEIKWIP
jgi:cob(I)alamin adenosyltransferase